LCKSCRTCFKFYCMFYFTCDRSLIRDESAIVFIVALYALTHKTCRFCIRPTAHCLFLPEKKRTTGLQTTAFARPTRRSKSPYIGVYKACIYAGISRILNCICNSSEATTCKFVSAASAFLLLSTLHCVPKKGSHQTFFSNFVKF